MSMLWENSSEKNGSINKFLMEIPSQNVKKLAFFNKNIPLIVVSMETICMAKSQDAKIYLTTTLPFENKDLVEFKV